MIIRRGLSVATILASTTLLTPAVHADTAAPTSASAQTLDDQFLDPPASARPRVWWHWMNGNISKDGIAKDLAWMKAMGIGGLQNFDANLATPQIVDKRIVYMTPEWKDAFRFATMEADRHGLELAIASSPGWSATGGPWVQPADGMKKLVWSETVVPGGKPFRGILAASPDTTGPFQTMPFAEDMPGLGGGDHAKPTASGSIALLAVPVPDVQLPKPAYALVDGTAVSSAALTDANLGSVAKVPLADDLSAAVQVSYPRAVTIRSMRLSIPGIKLPFRGVPLLASLEVRDGLEWKHICDIPLTSVPTTRAIPATTGQHFRLRFAENPDKGNLDMLNAAPGAVSINFFDTGPLKAIHLADFQLFAENRVDRAEEKAGYDTVLDYHAIATANDGTADISTDSVIDLTSRIKPDGTIDWTPPKGRDWRLIRFGWSLTGKTNHPATPEATGLEVDKFDAAAVRRYLETYIGMYRDTVGADLIGKRGVRAILTDSIEVGRANWTGAMEAEFSARRGYALRPWLPALTGIIIGTPAQTDKFLFDYRQTLAELLADKLYGTVAKVAHENDMIVYGEALEDKRPLLGDDLAMRAHADVPMAAMWTYREERQLRTTLIGDMRGAASVAHVYGKPFVAAESLTSVNAPWDFAPADLKPILDLEFVSGINRPVIHTSVHQPRDDNRPGMTLAIFGQYFNRHDSWASMARPWVDYISRTSLMLQQGHNVADVAWFIGEESPVTALYAEKIPAGLPANHAYDFINAQMLSDALRNDGADLTTPGCARYKAMYLGGTSQQMTLPTLQRLAQLVRSGATLIGKRPVGTPSAADDQAKFAALADALWGGDTGSGRVIATQDIDAGLAQAGIAPDFRMDTSAKDAQIAFVHRKLPDGEIWFVNNRKATSVDGNARFRITAMQPELWHAETGKSEPLPYRIENGETVVPLSLVANDAVFVVFRKPATAASLSLPNKEWRTVSDLSQGWTVAFEAGKGAPASIAMPRLLPLEQHGDPGVKYFSGVATYSRQFTAPKTGKPGAPVWLDLGVVSGVAHVTVNGKPAGYAWHPPYRVDIGGVVAKGRNTVEVKVANTWVNRLIGDAQPGATPIGKPSAPTYRADAPLRASGMIGPVKLLQNAD